ncbi:metallophosphoesterase [Croceicoccus sp. F390]|uniref:Metallophosphoesterase n=1 Tax=Croceicoccus esteveae TaxID=3075597 RepID=A0ABU2ZHT0_9SPHN|nr:metallophosphoesterase [Croceicoccus sp. F390]MDT0576159.1 metallophosphoesterase [Croceicoccus sp. F390]
MSDIHFGLEDRRALDWVAGEIEAQKPDAVAITGDVTMRARHREFAAACAWIGSLKVPVTVEVGNHDMPYFNPVERFLHPYRRFRAIEGLLEQELNLPATAVIPLKTAARAQWRLDWSKGWITRPALEKTLAAIDRLPVGTRALITAHHPLVEAGTSGTALTHGGNKALRELARRNVLAVLSGHVHDAFDLVHDTDEGQVRMIGAGTLSRRLRSTPPSFNELRFENGELRVKVRNLEHVRTADMQIDDVPEDAMPPRKPGEPVAPVGFVPPTDPPVH